MHIKAFTHQGVRNLIPGQIDLGAGLNIFYGDNGAGKSSILEALGFLTSGRSFRTSKIELMLSEKQKEFFVYGLTDDSQRLGVGYQAFNKTKSIKINRKKIHSLSELTRLYPTQIISPESYHLIDSGPGERRKYLDWCLFHVKHQYHTNWKAYTNILKQRNALLKRNSLVAVKPQIEVWDEQLCKAASLVNQQRNEILLALQGELSKIIGELKVDFCEDLQLNYYAGYTGELKEKLKASLHFDCESGFTKFGPHKADLRIKINGYMAKDYLSRGQKKVLINALYLAQTVLLKSLTAKDSLFMIDDFTSEIDSNNQTALLSLLMAQKNVQIVLSCLHQDSLKWLKKGYNSANMFHVEHGVISSVTVPQAN